MVCALHRGGSRTRGDSAVSVATRSGLPQDMPRQQLTFTYDAEGRRRTKKVYDEVASSFVLSTTTKYFYDGWNLLEERITDQATSTTTINRFVWGKVISGSVRGAAGAGGDRERRPGRRARVQGRARSLRARRPRRGRALVR